VRLFAGALVPRNSSDMVQKQLDFHLSRHVLINIYVWHADQLCKEGFIGRRRSRPLAAQDGDFNTSMNFQGG
jgi:hypothetical protein